MFMLKYGYIATYQAVSDLFSVHSDGPDSSFWCLHLLGAPAPCDSYSAPADSPTWIT